MTKIYKKCQLKGCDNVLTGRQTKYCCNRHAVKDYNSIPIDREKRFCQHPECNNEIVGNRKYCCPDHGYAARSGQSIDRDYAPTKVVGGREPICAHCKKPLGKNRDGIYHVSCRAKHKKQVNKRADNPVLGL